MARDAQAAGRFGSQAVIDQVPLPVVTTNDRPCSCSLTTGRQAQTTFRQELLRNYAATRVVPAGHPIAAKKLMQAARRAALAHRAAIRAYRERI
jgi:hypothetical protein